MELLLKKPKDDFFHAGRADGCYFLHVLSHRHWLLLSSWYPGITCLGTCPSQGNCTFSCTAGLSPARIPFPLGNHHSGVGKVDSSQSGKSGLFPELWVLQHGHQPATGDPTTGNHFLLGVFPIPLSKICWHVGQMGQNENHSKAGKQH